jgi:hypothetical protein
VPLHDYIGPVDVYDDPTDGTWRLWAVLDAEWLDDPEEYAVDMFSDDPYARGPLRLKITGTLSCFHATRTPFPEINGRTITIAIPTGRYKYTFRADIGPGRPWQWPPEWELIRNATQPRPQPDQP